MIIEDKLCRILDKDNEDGYDDGNDNDDMIDDDDDEDKPCPVHN